MLATANRLTGKKNYDKVKKEGQLFQSGSFGLNVFKREDTGPSRFGIIVSNKVSKHASMRNKAKRTLREAVRHSLTYLKSGHDVVFLAKSSIVRKYSSELMQEVIDSFKAAGLVK